MRRPVAWVRAAVAGMLTVSCVGVSAPPPRPATAGVSAPPAGPVTAPAAGDGFRSHPPIPEPPPPFEPPEPVITTLPNGMGLIVVEQHEANVVDAELTVRGGPGAWPDDSSRAVTLMLDSALHGTKSLNEAQIFGMMTAGLFEIHRRDSNASIGFSLRGESPSFPGAIPAFSEIVLAPTFPKELVEAIKSNLLEEAEPGAEKPDLIAWRNLLGAVYGPDHPYTRTTVVRDPHLAQLSRHDLARMRRTRMDPARTTLVVAGDVDPERVRRLVVARFGDWRTDPSRRDSPPLPPPSPRGARLIAVDRPGAPLATVFYGGLVPFGGAEQTAADMVARDLIGGLPSSTLTTTLREELGAVSKTDTRFWNRQTDGFMWWSGGVAPGRLGPALAALDARVRELRARDAEPAELAIARVAARRSLPVWMETTTAIARSFTEVIETRDLRAAADYFPRLAARIESVPWAEVRAALPDPRAVKVVVVGDLASLTAPLVSLGWGPIDVHDADGRLVRTIDR
jgi:zinc protease